MLKYEDQSPGIPIPDPDATDTEVDQETPLLIHTNGHANGTHSDQSSSTSTPSSSSSICLTFLLTIVIILLICVLMLMLSPSLQSYTQTLSIVQYAQSFIDDGILTLSSLSSIDKTTNSLHTDKSLRHTQHLQHTFVPLDPANFIYARCLGWGAALLPTPPIPPSSKLSLANPSGAGPATVPSSLDSSSLSVSCTVPPSNVIQTFFHDLYRLYPGLLTYRPSFSCYNGVYLLVDWHYTDGIGNSMWSYALAISMAMSLNATIINTPFAATHTETESQAERFIHFRFHEWEISRNIWEACPNDTPVKQNQFTTAKISEEWRPDTAELTAVRSYIRQIQTEQANIHNTQHMQQSLDAATIITYLNHDHIYTNISLPRVDFISPGVTIHLQAIQVTQDNYYKYGLYPPGDSVAQILEVRYLAQQDQWRKQLHPQDLLLPKPLPEGSIYSSSWLNSHIIHVSIPIRRGDVTSGSVGKEVGINVDLRQRVMTDEAIIEILTQSIQAIKDIKAGSHQGGNHTDIIYSGHIWSGQDILDRMIFTIYSEGPELGFIDIVNSLISLGIPQSRIRLTLGGAASKVFSLLTESDLIYMAPSSFSYAAACYYNSESVKIGTGWTYSRFALCRNFIYAQWIRYIPEQTDKKFIRADNLGFRQTWKINDIVDFQKRIIRMVHRKQLQNEVFHPIIKDNFRHEYPIAWRYLGWPQSDVEVRIPPTPPPTPPQPAPTQ